MVTNVTREQLHLSCVAYYCDSDWWKVERHETTLMLIAIWRKQEENGFPP